MGTGEQSRPGTSRRVNLARAHNKSGNPAATLWYVYSGHSASDWVLEGQLEWANYLWLEATPRVSAVNYAPAHSVPRSVSKLVVSTALFADGMTEWHAVFDDTATAHFTEAAEHDIRLASLKLAAKAATAAGARLVCRTKSDIQARSLLLGNWARAISWIAACRDHPLDPSMVEVASVMRACRTATLETLTNELGHLEIPKLYAAIFRLIQIGRLEADLDLEPLSRRTLLRERQSDAPPHSLNT
ncbi:hypothetical protein LMG3441_00658 [Achromobacter kerstersii]|uniref:TnsA endonuclease N-terminal domain-containing protein n=1 Tax=Achromobacter kerstersii TaxID=1353890 RepID=A0A6S6Z8M9_9BURK|nr:hypothetical protein LMG3441_00658 [Achromobacter kerstersii]